MCPTLKAMPQPSNQILTVAQMQAAEQALIDSGISVDELMQRAGRGAAEYVWRMAAGRAVTVLCGPGNNGGDGYVIAEVLRERRLDVAVIAPMEPKTDAARNARALYGGPVSENASGRSGGVFVDCLFGSGLKRPLSEELLGLVTGLAGTHELTVAIDLPSGIESDSGALLNNTLPTNHATICLGAWKYAHWLMPASATMGERRLVDIGVKRDISSATLLTKPKIFAPAPDAHKYRRGLLALVGGAMPGASLLAARAAQHGGAGYVKLVAPNRPDNLPPDIVFDGEPETDAIFTDDRIGALLVGPGLGRDDNVRCILQSAINSHAPLVLDADALALIGPQTGRALLEDAIATPHDGELATLEAAFDLPGEGAKPARAAALAKASGMIIVAKGPDTVIAAPDGRIVIAPPASSWLSVAGTGDVLAGIIASRLATGRPAFEAACEGVWLHGEAARLAGPAFSASDLADAVPRALASCL